MKKLLNITPHETGIGAWTESEFIDRFKMHENQRAPIREGQF